MKPNSWRVWTPIAGAALVLAVAGAGAACAQPEQEPAETEMASVCDGSPLKQATVLVEEREGEVVISVDPDPIRLCANAAPSVARWTLDDRTGRVSKWDIQGNATKECASGGKKAPLSFEVAQLEDSWIGDRSSRRPPSAGDCWAYDVLVQIDGEVIVFDPEIDWGT